MKKERMRRVCKKYQNKYPLLISYLLDDKEALLNHLKLPYRHRKIVRITNLVERSFEEEKRENKNNSQIFN